ncbi:MAG: hypothetical protein OXN84_21330 [Albidovulum sp.]|nr:hypothetical protein [Albidovulum sp.]MDE0531168.1 hypothetical protein [Albidovulum sp.]
MIRAPCHQTVRARLALIYMRQEFGLDALSSHDLNELVPETIVVNPRRRLYD